MKPSIGENKKVEIPYLTKHESREGLHRLITNFLLVEIKDRSQADDIDMAEIIEDVAQATKEELDRLVLLIIEKIAREVNHIISRY